MRFCFFILFFLFNSYNSTLIESDFLFCAVGKKLSVEEFCDENSNVCLYQKSVLQSFADKDDLFNIFKKDFVIYSNKQELFYTECSKIEKIDVIDIDTKSKCYKDIFIHFDMNGVIHEGFLTTNGVIRKDTSPIECLDKEEVFFSISKKKILIRNQNKIQFNSDKSKFILHKLNNLK